MKQLPAHTDVRQICICFNQRQFERRPLRRDAARHINCTYQK